eukprot:gene5378-biopygen2010
MLQDPSADVLRFVANISLAPDKPRSPSTPPVAQVRRLRVVRLPAPLGSTLPPPGPTGRPFTHALLRPVPAITVPAVPSRPLARVTECTMSAALAAVATDPSSYLPPSLA